MTSTKLSDITHDGSAASTYLTAQTRRRRRRGGTGTLVRNRSCENASRKSCRPTSVWNCEAPREARSAETPLTCLDQASTESSLVHTVDSYRPSSMLVSSVLSFCASPPGPASAEGQ